MANVTGKTILITGGTSGIGRETALGLATMGATIVVSGRNKERGEAGVADIKERSSSDSIELILADMSSLQAVRSMAAEFKERFDRLDVLINNVGYLSDKPRQTVDGFEATLAVNHLAWIVLTQELMPLLEASAPSRVINVTGGQLKGGIDFDNIRLEKNFVGLDTYSHAKRIMTAGSYAFAKTLEGTGVTLNVAYPGAANTSMSQQLSGDLFAGPMKLLAPVFKLFVASQHPSKAAVSSIYLASSPEVEGVNGKYFDTKAKQVNWPGGLAVGDLPQRVWQETEAMLESLTSHAD